MSQINVGATMQAIADRAVASGVVARAYGWPSEQVQPPCLVVGYPEGEIDFDFAFGRASDRAVFPVWLVVGKTSERAARDVISGYLAGVGGLKDALDGDLGGAVQTACVTRCQIEEITVSGVPYLAAKFLLDVIT